MRKITDTTMEDDIVEIKIEQTLIELISNATKPFPNWLVNDWIMGKPPKRIADDNGVPFITVCRMLDELAKAIIEATRI